MVLTIGHVPCAATASGSADLKPGETMTGTALVPAYVPPAPADEAQRLAALERYGILDTPPEEAFETIVDLACSIFEVPVALVTFLDESRQWFKSRRGIVAESSARHVALCAQTILSDDGLVAPSLLEDERFLFNPFVTGATHLRFYAGVPLVAPDGCHVGSIGVADIVPRHDFDARKHAILRGLAHLVVDELELRLARARVLLDKRELEFGLTNAQMGVWTWDLQTDRFELPPTLATIFRDDGLRAPPAEEATLAGLSAMVVDQDAPRVRHQFEKLRDAHAPLHAMFRLDCQGRPRWVEVHADFSPDSDTLVVGTVRDVTEREELRAHMLQLDRLRALSTLGAGIAHEINNPLSVVATNLYLMERWVGQDDLALQSKQRDYVHTLVRQARRGAERISAVVDAMLRLSRGEEALNVSVDICELLDSLAEVVRGQLPGYCELEVNCQALPPVRGGAGLLGQVFVNLLTNAIAAVEAVGPDSGAHNISVRARPGEAGRVRVTIRDTGRGIAPDDLARVFDPFFTTKAPGKGVGLGLSITQSLLQTVGAEIAMQSTLGKGTTVTVTLATAPRLNREPPEGRPSAPR